MLFCDIVGFTPLSESADPEAVRELLSSYFVAARTVIGRYGGVVEKFIGDAVMAVWGTPTAQEGDAERAVRAALDLVAEVTQLGNSSDVAGLAARAGVVTGEVAVTLGAVGEGMVAGDAVNTAARIQSAAEPGSVLVDGATRRLASSTIGFADAGDHLLKGKTEPVRLWRATWIMSAFGGAYRMDGLAGPMVGRDPELRTIKELFHATVDRHSPRLVLVSGPAGVGKSRLSWEFEKYVDGLAESVRWHRGRCLSYGNGVAFWALAEMVRQRLDIAEGDASEAASVRFAEGLADLIPDPGERSYVATRLGRLLGLPVAGADGSSLAHDDLFAGWRLFFERLATEHPVVLLVEDAQHADAGLLDFLEYLVDWVRGLPLFVLVMARPELAVDRPAFGVGRNRITLTLDPLDAMSMNALVEALVPGMAADARSAVANYAQGLPLFAVETVRSLIDRDVVQPVDGVYRLVGQVGDLAVPETLHALLAARLDALDPAGRQLISDAAVLGTTFPAEALVMVSGRDEASVRAGLAELVRRDVLTISADPLSPERGSYQFTHQMLRQVAYDTLSRRDRKARHLAVAAHLRTSFSADGEEVAEVVASHYIDAMNAVPDDPDASNICVEAIQALIRAAERAERTGAPASAAASYTTAAELSLREPSEGEATWPSAGALWESASLAARNSGNFAASAQNGANAQAFYLEHNDGRAAARAQVAIGRALLNRGRHAEGREQFAAAAQVLCAQPDGDYMEALIGLARVAVIVASPDADSRSAEVLSLAQAAGTDARTLSSLFNLRGAYHSNSARNAQAAAYYREAARLAAQAGHHELVAATLANLSDSLSGTDPAAAAAAAESSVTAARMAGNLPILALAIANRAQALMMLGEWNMAWAEMSLAADADGLQANALFACQLSLMAALRGDDNEALAMLAALPDIRESDDPQDNSLTELAEAFAASAGGRIVESLRHARAVLEQLPALGIGHNSMRWGWPLAARSAWDLGDETASEELLSLLNGYQPGHMAPMLLAERDLATARLAARRGDPAATGGLDAAVAALRDRGTPYHLAHGLLDLVAHRRLLGSADGADAKVGGELAEAREIAGQLSCRPLLDRANAIDALLQQAPA